MNHANNLPQAGVAVRARSWLMPAARLAVLSLVLALPAAGMAAPVDDSAKVVELVRRHNAAKDTYDVPALEATVADNYIEISPLGEIDPRDKMLGFYDPKNRKPTPLAEFDEVITRVFGDSAVVIGRLAFSVPGPDGKPRAVGIRGSFAARKTGETWKLVSVQYTGIRPPQPAAPKADAPKN